MTHVTIYLVRVTTPLSPDEIRAAAAIHHELGPDYQTAVVDSFLEKVGREIDARVDARLQANARPPAAAPATPYRTSSDRGQIFLAVASIALGIPITAIVLAVGTHPAGLAGLLIVWAAIAAINIAYAVRRPHGR